MLRRQQARQAVGKLFTEISLEMSGLCERMNWRQVSRLRRWILNCSPCLVATNIKKTIFYGTYKCLMVSKRENVNIYFWYPNRMAQLLIDPEEWMNYDFNYPDVYDRHQLWQLYTWSCTGPFNCFLRIPSQQGYVHMLLQRFGHSDRDPWAARTNPQIRGVLRR